MMRTRHDLAAPRVGLLTRRPDNRRELLRRVGGAHIRVAPVLRQHIVDLPQHIGRERQQEMTLIMTFPPVC